MLETHAATPEHEPDAAVVVAAAEVVLAFVDVVLLALEVVVVVLALDVVVVVDVAALVEVVLVDEAFELVDTGGVVVVQPPFRNQRVSSRARFKREERDCDSPMQVCIFRNCEPGYRRWFCVVSSAPRTLLTAATIEPEPT